MGFFVKEKHVERLRERLKRNQENDLQVQLYKVLVERTYRNTREDRLVQTCDTQEWYHLVWERMSDAAFVYSMEHDERLGKWVHDRTMELVRMPLDGWIGPWFRKRNEAYQIGALETSHITLAVCEAYDNAGDVFTEEEKQEIASAVTQKGLILCKRFVESRWGSSVNNWDIVLLTGYGVAAALFGVEAEIRRVLEIEEVFSSIYNKDSYGESVQYSNYASLCLNHLHRVLVNTGYARISDLHPSYFRLIEWYAYSFQRMKYLESFDTEVPRTFAFGDSSNLFRPTADVLVQTAIWGQTHSWGQTQNCDQTDRGEKCSKIAALAAWMFHTIYSKETGLIDEMATFGFFNQFTYDAVLRMPDMAAPLSPGELKLPLAKRFEIGHVIARDSWEKPKMQVAIAAGYEPLKVTAHRHRDQNSFQLTVGEERMLVDPGHCCYRLQSQKKSTNESSHNTASILYQGELLEQRGVCGSIWRDQPVFNHLVAVEKVGDLTVVISDGSDLYPAPVKRALRIWLLRLPDMVMVIDDVAATEPVKLITRFVANNRDNCLEAYDRQKHQLFLKRKGVELSINVLQNLTDEAQTEMKMSYDWTYLHEYYHPLPNQKPQGREGSALTYVWEDTVEAKEHRRVHLLTPDHRAAMPSIEECFAEYQFSYELKQDVFRFTAGTEVKEWKLTQ